ncbi:hypothetical protein SISSUDRAFT_198676 [Sistotremastrum suecicum HHB10207 ss-3]|uniref:Uncharacterized protein n=1 Tax=Sistotremastrum suecicum HHB10207 ss-3 TaxID=1314776 RepID=A0A166AA51_9AGAM|nr:hypothetical protein SISSUDRAFT_198676 [Sistotremastrum suecicum HHB10207 ss-3]
MKLKCLALPRKGSGVLSPRLQGGLRSQEDVLGVELYSKGRYRTLQGLHHNRNQIHYSTSMCRQRVYMCQSPAEVSTSEQKYIMSKNRSDLFLLLSIFWRLYRLKISARYNGANIFWCNQTRHVKIYPKYSKCGGLATSESEFCWAKRSVMYV